MNLTIVYQGKDGAVRLTENREVTEADFLVLLGLAVALPHTGGRTNVLNQILGAIRGVVGFTSSYKLKSLRDNDDSTRMTLILVSR